MRIISGIYGGRRYKGKIPDGVRPTLDQARESIFNILMGLKDVEDAVVADICAGTGALGLEALSRGGEHITYVEKNRKVVDMIKKIMLEFKVPDEEYEIINTDAVKFCKSTEKKFDIIFSDPPYKAGFTNDMLKNISERKLLKDDGIMVLEYSKNYGIALPVDMEIIKEKNFGETIVAFIEMRS